MSRVLTRIHKDKRGSVLLEATLVMPLIVMLVAGIADYGVTLYQYHTLSTATGSAVRQLTISRGFNTPFQTTYNQFGTWAPNMAVQTSQITVSVENASGTMVSCTDTVTTAQPQTCKTLLDGAAGKRASVALNYACKSTFIPSMASPCPIKITATGMVE